MNRRSSSPERGCDAVIVRDSDLAAGYHKGQPALCIHYSKIDVLPWSLVRPAAAEPVPSVDDDSDPRPQRKPNDEGDFMSSAVAVGPARPVQPVRDEVESQFQYPGMPTTCDGAEAVVHVEIHVAQAAGAYPITSSTTMGGGFNAAVMNGGKNLWGDSLMFFEPESEHSAASVCEGFAVAGAAEASFTPFFSAQDGFLTTHTVETVRLPETAFMKEFIGDPKEKLINLMDPANPVMSGVVQNQDSYMKGKIAQRTYYDKVGPALEEAFDEFARKTGRRYGYVEPYRCEDAEYILVGMGCYMETAKATINYLRDVKGVAAGCLTVFTFRPFPAAT